MIEVLCGHQESPSEKLAQVLEEEQTVDRATLFQVLCNYQKVAKPEPPRPAGITIAPFQAARVVGPLEASITAIEMIFDVKDASTNDALTVSVNRRQRRIDISRVSLRIKEHRNGNILQALVLQTATVVKPACVLRFRPQLIRSRSALTKIKEGFMRRYLNALVLVLSSSLLV